MENCEGCLVHFLVLSTVICLHTLTVGNEESTLISSVEDVNDLFAASFHKTLAPKSNLENGNVSFDIAKMDKTKLMRQFQEYAKVMSDDDIRINQRRQFSLNGIELKKKRINKKGSYYIATRLKTLDLMLQTIYMARYHITNLEKDKLNQEIDTPYRMGLLKSHIQATNVRIAYIYGIMLSKYRHNEWNTTTNKYILYHERVVKLHTDLQYSWYVAVRMDKAFREKNRLPKRYLPKKLAATAGITDDEKSRILYKG